MTRNRDLPIWCVVGLGIFAACGDSAADGGASADAPPGLPDPGSDAPPEVEPGPDPAASAIVDVELTPRAGVGGVQRVNFAVPLARGQLAEPDQVRVLAAGVEVPAARRALARYRDGSVRSVQLQVDADLDAARALQVRIGEPPETSPLELAAVSTTLQPADGTQGPRVWARLPASWLVASGVTGPQLAETAETAAAFAPWQRACDFDNHTVTEFLGLQAAKDVWLYDRGTIFYRAYARRGDLRSLESAYRETAIYRSRMSGTGAGTRIGVPGSATDVKYHYAQHLAIHYLLTGDDRFRDAAEDIAIRVDALWNPHYRGGGQFWTERHAGFSLLAYVWARIVTDDKAERLDALAREAAAAYREVQARYPAGWSDAAARCFAHETRCSPWMSAILADALDAYATEQGGAEAEASRASIVQLGKILARDGRDASGKPFYMMGVGPGGDEIDPYDEHWGEPAYAIAMAWHHGGRTDAALRTAVDELLAGLRARGTSPHMRSFNWQCRSAMATPYYLR